jgi:transcriptional regulator with XRE-family HTH domain
MREMTIQPDGCKIREKRVAMQLTQEELANLVGCSKRTIENAEAGRRIKESFLGYIATALRVEQAELSELGPEADHGANKMSYIHFQWVTGSIDDWLRQLLHPFRGRNDILRELPGNLHRAANHTISYKARVEKHHEERDIDRELQLSDEWHRVGELLLEVQDEWASVIAQVIRSKATYWADIDRWSSDDLNQADIRLSPIVKQVEQLIERLEQAEPRATAAGGGM